MIKNHIVFGVMCAFAVIFVMFALSVDCVAADGVDSIRGWRGDGTGKYENADAPVRWSEDDNVLWKTAMNSFSNAHPIFAGKRMFIGDELTDLVCMDMDSGEILWRRDNSYEKVLSEEERDRYEAKQKVVVDAAKVEMEQIEAEVAKLTEEDENGNRRQIQRLNRRKRDVERKMGYSSALKMPGKDGSTGYTSPTPVTDGKYVYVVYGTGTVVCYDIEGELKWSRLYEKSLHGWGHSSSPALIGDKLIVHIEGLVALDTATGKEVWRTECERKWGSPTATKIDGVDVVIMSTGDVVRVSDGRKLGDRIGGLSYGTPVVEGDIVYLIEGRGRAVRLIGIEGDTLKTEKLWESRLKGSRHYGSVVVHDGLIYAVSREEWFGVVDAKTGEVVYEKQLEFGGDKNEVYVSVTLGGENIYVGGEMGKFAVIKLGREYVEVVRNEFEGTRSSPVFIDGRMYVRGFKHMWCIGEQKASD